jgi:hypothetical protein
MMKQKKVRPGDWRERWYDVLCREEGRWCKRCGRMPPEIYLEVDAINGKHDQKNCVRTNVQLLCKSCNRRKDPRGKARRKGFDSSVLDQPKASTAEMHKNQTCRPVFLAWLAEEIERKGGWADVEHIVQAGAHVSNLSSVTIRRYLGPLTADIEEAPYIIPTHLEPKKIGFKHRESIGLTADLEGSV